MKSHDPSLPPEPLPLTEASVQEIQLELIRRRRFNEFDGRRIVATLRQYRQLWRAAILDRTATASDTPGGLGNLELIKLRDLPSNHWNVDTLFVLCETLGNAHRLVELATEKEWNADVMQVHENRDELVRALGTSDPGGVIASFWWD
jgi:hypothetical protein